MSVHFRCVCSAVLNVPDDQVGTYGECPSCGKVLQAPERAVSFEPIVMADAPAPEPAVAFEPAGPATAVADEPPAAVPDSPEPEPVMAAEPAAEPAEEKPATVFEAQLLAAAATSDEETVMAHAAPAMAVPPADQPVPVADPEYMQAQVAADDTAAEVPVIEPDTAAEVPVIEPDTAPADVEKDDDMYEARTLIDPIPNLAELEAIRAAAPEPTPQKDQQPAATGRGRASAKTRRGKTAARTSARGKRERRRPLDVLTREEEQYVEVKKKGGFFKKVVILLFLVIVLVVGVLVVHIYDVIPIKQLEENSVIGPYVRQIREILRPDTIDEGAADEKAGNATENTETETEAGKDTKHKEQKEKQKK